MDRRKFLVLATSTVAAGASALAVPRVGAQSVAFPNRPITFVVPYPPGSSAPDLVARIFAAGLPEYLGQNVIVENKPGASAQIGSAAVARAKNDGYTLLLVSPASWSIGPWLYRTTLPYDTIKDFTPIIKVVTASNILLVPPQSPSTSVQDLMRRMKERTKENSFRYNHTSTGSSQHLQGALLARLAGATADHVPYRSNADQFTALMTNQVDYGFATVAAALGMVKGGRLRALGVTSPEPASVLPDVPSLSSTAGLEEFNQTNVWFGVVGPKDMPDAVVQTLHGAFAKALSNPDIQAKLRSTGFGPVPPAPASEFAQFVRDQSAFWGGLVKASGVSLN